MRDDDRNATLQGWRVVSAREAALRILAPRFADTANTETSIPLASFQRATVEQARAILEKRRGVVIADSIGLGKTFVALALIESALARNEAILVLVPACLRRMWRNELRRLNRPVTLLSHTQLGHGGGARLTAPFDLIVVDEAHAFRNPHTRRYRGLKALVRDAAVIMLTATPINNSISDLYFQLRLFCADSAFRDLGLGSLRAVLMGDSRPTDLVRLKHAAIVRRTRADARRALLAYDGVRPESADFRFPRRTLTHAVRYDLSQPVVEIRAFLDRLCFPAHRLDARPGVSPQLIRFVLLKRLESSRAALAATLQRHIRFYEEFIPALEKGMLLRPRTFRALCDHDEGALQLVLDVVALDVAGAPASVTVESARNELAALREWHARLRDGPDAKLDRLQALLAARAGAKTVVFTEFRDTARYLWKALRRHMAVGLIDGAGAWIGEAPASRRQVVERFAPRANRCPPFHEREAIAVLIATDVLAEGMNLQDADAVVSYDLPWNPVRLIQRAGRVDRIGSMHDVAHVHNLLPDREFDAFLGLARTLRSKLETVRGVVGLEASVLEPDDEVERVMRSLAAGDPNTLESLEDGRASRLRAEFEKAAPLPAAETVAVGALPDASGTRLVVGLARQRAWLIAHIDAQSGAEVGTGEDCLLRALSEARVVPAVVDPIAVAAARYMEQLNLRCSASPLGAESAAGRVARAIRARLVETGASTTPHLLDLADDVLALLTTVTDVRCEDELDRLARRHGSSLEELLTAVRNVLALRREPALQEVPWRLIGVLVAD